MASEPDIDEEENEGFISNDELEPAEEASLDESSDSEFDGSTESEMSGSDYESDEDVKNLQRAIRKSKAARLISTSKGSGIEPGPSRVKRPKHDSNDELTDSSEAPLQSQSKKGKGKGLLGRSARLKGSTEKYGDVAEFNIRKERNELRKELGRPLTHVSYVQGAHRK